ncbi:MAG: InlB B-repeat-containing protein [Oscillospiraceae bacterium]|nr:InlB B-repeat-containing protein [Oscillospiraceae bacterium]
MRTKKYTSWICISLAIIMLIGCFPVQIAAASGTTHLIKFKSGTAEDGVTSKVVYTSEVTYGDLIGAPTTDVLWSFEWPADKEITGWYLEGDAAKTALDFSTLTCTGDMTFLPIYGDCTTCYVFFASDGLSTTMKKVPKGDRVSEPADPVREGYTFQYWSLDGTTAFSFTTPITSHTTLRAVWEAQEVSFKVMFYVEKADMDADGTPGDFSEYIFAETHVLKGTAGENTNLTKETLSSYGLDAYFNGTTTADTGLKYMEFQEAFNKEIAGDGTTVISAFLLRKTYEICYDINNHYSTYLITDTRYGMIIDGETYTSVDNPVYTTKVKIGNQFNGPNTETEFFAPTPNDDYRVLHWYTDPNMAGHIWFYSTTLFPTTGLSPNFVSADGQTEAYTFGAYWGNGAIAIPTREWYEPLASDSGGITINIPDDTTTYHADIAGQTFQYNPKYDFTSYGAESLKEARAGFSPLCVSPYYSGYATAQDFIYQSNDEDDVEFYTYPTADTYKVLSLFYARNSYDLIFDVQTSETQTTDYSSKSIKYEAPLEAQKPDDPVRSGYEFLGWYENVDFETPYDFSTGTMPASNLTLFAKWREIVPEYKVNFYDYYGGTILNTETVREGEMTPEQAYYVLGTSYALGTFSGWRYHIEGAIGVSSEFSFTLPVFEDMDVYASWNPGYFNVTYLLGSGSGTTPVDSDNYAPGTSARVASGTGITGSGGSTFIGWKDQDGNSYDPDSLAAITRDLVLTAQYKTSGGGGTSTTTYKVTYSANGGSGTLTDPNSPYHSGATVTVLSPGSNITPQSGYAFVRWNTAADGTGTDYQADDTFIITKNTTLYAQWKEAEDCYIYYDANGGTGTLADGNNPYQTGDSVTILTPTGSISRSGYGFLSWNTQSDGSGTSYAAYSTLVIQADTTLYAQWQRYNGGSDGGITDIIDPMPPLGEWELNLDDHYAYLIGYPDDTVRPNANVSREESATIFFRLLTDDTRDELLSKSNSFGDVASNRWSNTAISTLAAAGVLSGRPDGTFDPAGYITRAEFATLAAGFDERDIDITLTYSDTAGHWAEEAISRATALGWIQGRSDGTFGPDEYITRAEVATFVNRMLLRLIEDESAFLPGMKVWPDNSDTSQWYYLVMQEATNSHLFERVSDDSNYEIWLSLIDDPDWLQYEV